MITEIYLLLISIVFSKKTKTGFKTAAKSIPANMGKHTWIINDKPFSK